MKNKNNKIKYENEELISFLNKFDNSVNIEKLTETDIKYINEIPITNLLYNKILEQNQAIKDIEKRLNDISQRSAEILNNTLLYEKRINNNMQNEIKHQKINIFTDIIEFMDLINITYDSIEKNISISSIKNGLEMILSKIKKFFDKFEIKELNINIGDTYDCKIHEAISSEVDDRFIDENLIIKIIKPGFVINEQLIRPALVIVSKKDKGE